MPQTVHMSAAEQSAREREVLDRCIRAIEARGIPASAAEIGRRTGTADGQVRKILNQDRPLRPEFLCRLGQFAGLRVSELFAAIGWLPDNEALPPFSAALAQETQSALEALEQARPFLEQLTRPPQSAPLAAAEALLADELGAERFEARLCQIVSGGRYRTTTNAVGEFRLRDGHRPLPYDQALDLAHAAGVRELPDRAEVAAEPRFWQTDLELRARTCRALDAADEYSWQGGPGHRTWRSAAREWPAHLLVQDVIAGLQQPDAGEPGGPVTAGPIVFIGGRHGAGLAAAFLAQALGRQFVLVRENIDVTRHGHIVGLPVDARRHRTRAWVSIAEHIARRQSEGRPWPAVVLVRAAVFAAADGLRLDSHAARLLSQTSARLVYARMPPAYLDWWAARIEGNFRPGLRDGAAWARRMRSLYGRIEEVLAARREPRDLMLAVPEPASRLEPHDPEIPAEVMDWSARVAWTALCRMEGARLSGSGTAGLRPGRLAGWRELLATDPDAMVPAITS